MNTIPAYYTCPHCDNNYFSRPHGEPPRMTCAACGKESTLDECRKPITTATEKQEYHHKDCLCEECIWGEKTQ